MAATSPFQRPHSVDVVLGVACTAVIVAVFVSLPVLTEGNPEAASLNAVSPWSVHWWLVILGLVAQGLVLVGGVRAPRVALVAVATLAFALSLVTPSAAHGISSIAVLIAVFRAVVSVPLVRLIPALAGSGILIGLGDALNGVWGGAMTPSETVTGALVQALAVICLPMLFGLLVRSRNDVREARHDELQARAEQRDAQVQAAVSRERAAMARELHDIAAHHLSGIALMAAVVDRQIDTAPQEAHRGVQHLRAQSTAVLDDLRRLVGLLRDDSNGERSVQTLAAVPELVHSARLQGEIELIVLTADGRVLGTGIGPLAQLALYCTIQEALTNASTHAPGAVRTVEIDDRDYRHTVVTVTNAPPVVVGTPSTAGGFGLVGMRERAELVGADLRYGPTAEGGWQLCASVSRETSSGDPHVLSQHTQNTEDVQDSA